MSAPTRRGRGVPAPPCAPLLALVLALSGCAGGPAATRWAGDPDSVASAFAHPSAALAWPGSTRAFQVRAGGELYNGAWTVLLSPSADGVAAAPPRRIAFEDRWRPVAHWRRAAAGVTWEFEACALPAPTPADTSELVTLAVRAINTGATSAACTLRAQLAPIPAGAGWVAFDAPPAGSAVPEWSAPAGGAIAGLAPGMTLSGPLAEASAMLAPGASREWRLVLAAHAMGREALERWARVPHARRADEVRRYWERETGRGTRFELGDREVQDALKAARVVLLESRMRAAGASMPTAGPFQYRDVWLRDGARSVAALSVSGYTREARELADGLSLFQWSQGAFLSQRGQLDGNGQAPWAFAQAALRPEPDSTVARLAERALGACLWIEAQRAFGASAGWPRARLLPYAEPRDAELVRAQLVGNDAWSLAGLESTARLLRAAHREADAAHVDSLREAYAADFRAALAGCGRPDVPPSWQGKGHDWGNLAVAWPARALPASDPRLAVLAGRSWAACPEPGLTSYGTPDSLHAYVGADLGTWALLANTGRTTPASVSASNSALWSAHA